MSVWGGGGLQHKHLVKRVQSPLPPSPNWYGRVKKCSLSNCRKGRSSLETCLIDLVFCYSETGWIQSFFSDYIWINPSRDMLLSMQHCYSYSRSVKLRYFKSVENDYFNGDVALQIFWNFQNLNSSTIEWKYFLANFSCINMHMVHKTEKFSPLCSL